MADRACCPSCNRELALNAPQGLCPACLLRRALESDGPVAAMHDEPSTIAANTPQEPTIEGGRRRDADGSPPQFAFMDAIKSRDLGAVEAEFDVTLSYSVSRDGGAVEPFLSRLGLDQLAGTFTPGMVLEDRYVLERELGRGGMGLVFLGRDNRLDRPVAIKAIAPADAARQGPGPDDEHRAHDRFLQEAKIGANLTHPTIATVYDFGEHLGAPFTVFEYIAGPTLRDLIKRRGPLPLEEVQLIVGPLAQALDFAHSQFVVHLDLKPENIKTTEHGAFKILDLGLAREFRRPTDWRGFAGTPAYAAPEQAEGLPCDGRADQYSIAVIAYELLSGRRPFLCKNPHELLELHRHEEPPPLCSLAPEIPGNVEAAIHQALNKGPNLRFQSCEHFALAIGCRLLSQQIMLPEILLEAEANVPGNRSLFSMSKTACVALQADSLWIAENEGIEVVRWPLAAIESVTRRGRRTLVVSSSHAKSKSERLLTFKRAGERDRWHSTLDSLKSPQAGPQTIETQPTSCRIVPVKDQLASLRRRPDERYQVLGPVEALGRGWTSARSAMTIRAAMLGADAVADLNEERVPGVSQSNCRSSAVCLRSVDLAARQALAMRWFEQAVRAGTRQIIKVMLLFCLWLLVAVGLSAYNSAEHIDITAAAAFIILGSLPILPVLLLRRLYWPQLVPLVALACVIFAFYVCWAILLTATSADLNQVLRSSSSPWQSVNPFFLFSLYVLASLLVASRRVLWASRTFASLHPSPARPPSRRILVRALLYLLSAGYLAFIVNAINSGFRATGSAHVAQSLVDAALSDLDSDPASNRTSALEERVKVDAAIARLREAIRLEPDYADAHFSLGIALVRRENLDEAVVEFNTALAKKPDFAEARINLASALLTAGRLEEAITVYREIVRREPNAASSHYILGLALDDGGRAKEAIAEFREVIRLEPDDPEALCSLGSALKRQRDYAASLAMYRKGHEIGSKRPDWRFPSAEWLAEAESLASLDARWPAILSGHDSPRDAGERLFFAELAFDRKQFAAAASFWADALKADPALAANRQTQRAYEAARAAALAAAGRGNGPAPDAGARDRLRALALEWLSNELDAWRQFLVSAPPADRASVARKLEQWKFDPDLASVRESQALAKLPEMEQQAWRTHWSEVDALRRSAAKR
jgi:serine/threonine protein kinase/tetratricopeptide (TPR) repeat protein